MNGGSVRRLVPCLAIVTALVAFSSTPAHADVTVVKGEVFPRTARSRIIKRVKLDRVDGKPKLVYRLVSDGDFLRYFRIYVNGKRVLIRLLRTSVKGWIDLSAHIPRAGSYTIMYEIGSPAQSWRLESNLQGAEGTVTSWLKWRERGGKSKPEPKPQSEPKKK